LGLRNEEPEKRVYRGGGTSETVKGGKKGGKTVSSPKKTQRGELKGRTWGEQQEVNTGDILEELKSPCKERRGRTNSGLELRLDGNFQGHDIGCSSVGVFGWVAG